MINKRKRGFTLIELLLVIAVLAVLATITVVVLNPAEKLAQTRDSKRLQDLNTLKSAINLAETFTILQGQTFHPAGLPFVDSNGDGIDDKCAGQVNQSIFVSVPDSETPPDPPTNWLWAQVSSANLKNIDGSGWVPINFLDLPSGQVSLNVLPIDPGDNSFASGFYYSYVCGSYEFNAKFESYKFQTRYNTADGGNDDALYEIGKVLTLAPPRPPPAGGPPPPGPPGPPPPDTTPPSAPGTLTATPDSTTQITLAWGPATDNIGVTGYRVDVATDAAFTIFLANNTNVGNVLTVPLTGLSPNTAYYSRVRAYDAAANTSPNSTTAQAATYVSSASTFWTGDFETGNLGQWDAVQAVPGGITVVTSPVRQGTYAAKFVVNPGDDPINSSGERAELVGWTEETEGMESWWAWSMYLPTDFAYNSSTYNIITQWHQTYCCCSPNVDFTIYQNPPVLVLNVRGGTFNVATCTFSSANYFSLGTLATGTWHDIVYHVKWSANPSVGFVEVWLNGAQVVPKTFTGTLYSGYGVYLKQGLYRGGGNMTSVLYLDDTRRGQGYADVKQLYSSSAYETFRRLVDYKYTAGAR